MTHFDVFNGDADGLCALHQLRLATPRDSVLVTGVKRDIALLERVAATAGDSVTVLDVSLAANASALTRLLERGVSVDYFDHHYAGKIPRHPRLIAHIDAAPDVCTGMIVDRLLGGRYRAWAIVAAFGDNLHAPAHRLAESLGLTAVATAALRGLGEDLGYNGYGDCEADLIVHPAALYRLLQPYADPLQFLGNETVWGRIRAVREDDLLRARAVTPMVTSPGTAVVRLPDAAWSRRVHGALANELAVHDPERAHAVLTPDSANGVTVSVRAPKARPTGADRVCRAFPQGGGRAAAAGINHASASDIEAFLRRFVEAYG